MFFHPGRSRPARVIKIVVFFFRISLKICTFFKRQVGRHDLRLLCTSYALCPENAPHIHSVPSVEAHSICPHALAEQRTAVPSPWSRKYQSPTYQNSLKLIENNTNIYWNVLQQLVKSAQKIHLIFFYIFPLYGPGDLEAVKKQKGVQFRMSVVLWIHVMKL